MRLEGAKELRLIERAQNFEKVALPHLDALFRTALALSGNVTEAEDLSQSVIVRAMEKYESFAQGTNCKAWLFRILRNLWVDQLRRIKTSGTALPLKEALVAEAPCSQVAVWTNAWDLLENFSDEQIINALERLPDDQRLTLFLIDVEQMTQDEVATITNTAVGTVKSRTSRARAALKESLVAYAQSLGYQKG